MPATFSSHAVRHNTSTDAPATRCGWRTGPAGVPLLATWSEADELFGAAPYGANQIPVFIAHVMGGCAMSADERLGVTAADGRYRGLRNVSVHDGSLYFTDSASQALYRLDRGGEPRQALDREDVVDVPHLLLEKPLQLAGEAGGMSLISGPAAGNSATHWR
mgnify:CR=1 FL=1